MKRLNTVGCNPIIRGFKSHSPLSFVACGIGLMAMISDFQSEDESSILSYHIIFTPIAQWIEQRVSTP